MSAVLLRTAIGWAVIVVLGLTVLWLIALDHRRRP